jgi:predicted nucleic-acid-binding protein
MASPKGKKPVIIDANVILRYLLQDHQELYKKAEEIFNRILLGELKAFIPTFIVAEVVYVLQKVYKVDRPTISQVLTELLKPKGVKTENKKILFEALRIYAQRNLDFADCLLCAYSKNYEIFSFDKDLEKCI